MRIVSKLALALAASICLVATAGLPARAQAAISVHNASGHCAVVTVYTAWSPSPWSEVTINGQGRKFVEPGIWWPFFLPADPDVRVRAEILNSPTCSGRTIADVFAVRNGIVKDGRYVAKVEKTAKGYHVVIYR